MRLCGIALMVALGSCEHGQGGFPDGGFPTGQCGGFSGGNCGPGEFCDFGTDSCGAGDEGGTCVTRPQGCPDNIDPVCGCDGQIRANQCEAEAAGTDVNANGTCPVPSGELACGFRLCNLNESYCEHQIGLGAGDAFACKPLPAGCPGSLATCSCLAGELCGGSCSGVATSGFTLVCQPVGGG